MPVILTLQENAKAGKGVAASTEVIEQVCAGSLSSIIGFCDAFGWRSRTAYVVKQVRLALNRTQFDETLNRIITIRCQRNYGIDQFLEYAKEVTIDQAGFAHKLIRSLLLNLGSNTSSYSSGPKSAATWICVDRRQGAAVSVRSLLAYPDAFPIPFL
jgi:hypothetical protein